MGWCTLTIKHTYKGKFVVEFPYLPQANLCNSCGGPYSSCHGRNPAPVEIYDTRVKMKFSISTGALADVFGSVKHMFVQASDPLDKKN